MRVVLPDFSIPLVSVQRVVVVATVVQWWLQCCGDHLAFMINLLLWCADIAGMGADLFGSFAESTCAALVVASVSSIGDDKNWAGMMFPLGITAAGIIVCMITTLIATDLSPAHDVPSIEPTLKVQLVASTVIMTPVAAMLAFFTLGSEEFTLPLPDGKLQAEWWSIFLCVAIGLWSGLIIGLVTEYYTSNAYGPVQQVAGSCRTGAATNVIFGLALGYLSVIIPIFMIALAIFVGVPLPIVLTRRTVMQPRPQLCSHVVACSRHVHL